MAEIKINLPESFYGRLEGLVQQADQAARSAELALDMSSRLVGESSAAYTTLSEELKQQRETIQDILDRLHDLGNAVNGKVSATEVEIFIRQIVKEELENR